MHAAKKRGSREPSIWYRDRYANAYQSTDLTLLLSTRTKSFTRIFGMEQGDGESPRLDVLVQSRFDDMSR